MKKLFLSMTVIMLAVMLPLTANAATINAVTPNGKSEITVGDVVEITVKLDEKQVESMQFDLKYNTDNFKYIQESAESDLNSTLSHEIEPGVVRVSVIDDKEDGKTDNEVTMKFKSKAKGDKVDFSVVEGSVEVGTTTQKLEEKVKTPTVTIAKINDKVTGNGNGGQGGGEPQYVNDQGQVITALPKTGENTKAASVKSIDGVYGTLGNLQNVILYAFQTSETTLSLADVKAEFGNNISTSISGNAKTGDTITVDGNTYTIIIYGDVNGDGKVTTYDALLAKKIKLGKLTNISEFAREAANIEKSAIDTTAMQKFILRLRKTATDTILDKFPERTEATVDAISVQLTNVKSTLVYNDLTIGKVISTEGAELTENLVCYTATTEDGTDVSSMLKKVEISAGEYNIVLNATKAGTYTIKPYVMSGGKKIVDEANQEITLTINDDYTVNAIKLFNDGKEVTGDTLSLLAGQNITLNVKYYHIYRNDAGTELGRVEVTEENKKVTASEFTSEVENASGALFSNPVVLGNGDDVNPTLGLYINRIRITTSVTGKGRATITLKMNNEVVKTLNVDVTPEQVTQLKVNGTVKNNGDNFELPLYTYKPTDSNVVKIGNLYYTTFDIELLNNLNKKVPLPGDQITNKPSAVNKNNINKFIVAENASNLGSDIDVIGLDSNNNSVGTDEATRIGVAFKKLGNASSIEKVEQGITIYFGGIENDDGTVTRNTITVTVKKMCEHTWNSGTETLAPTCKDTGVKTFTCTGCGETKTETIPVTTNHNYVNGVCSVCGGTEVQADSVADEAGILDTVAPEEVTPSAPAKAPSATTKPAEEAKPSVDAKPDTTVTPDVEEEKKECVHELDLNDYVSDPAPTCTTSGIYKYKCKLCGEYISKEASATGHIYENGKCLVCGNEEVEKPAEPATNPEVVSDGNSVAE